MAACHSQPDRKIYTPFFEAFPKRSWEIGDLYVLAFKFETTFCDTFNVGANSFLWNEDLDLWYNNFFHWNVYLSIIYEIGDTLREQNIKGILKMGTSKHHSSRY